MSEAVQQSRPDMAPIGERLKAIAERLVFSSAPYRMLLLGNVPERLVQAPPVHGGDAQRGAALLRGELILAGERLAAPDPWAFAALEANDEGRAELHGFDWLSDLRAEGSPEARKRAQGLIAGWIEHFGEWSPVAWRGDVLGRRIRVWLAEYGFFAPEADEGFRGRFFRSLARQVRHLERIARFGGTALGPPGHSRIDALVALAEAHACMGNSKDRLARALALLLRELDAQVLPDGGHYQRNPALQFSLLRDLVGLRQVLAAGRHPMPAGLQTAIDRMAPMLCLFRHGDGRLALFNGAGEGSLGAIESVLALAQASGKPPAGAPHSGFQRLTAGDALVIMDTGAPPPPGSDDHAHAGTLSFEMSLGPERVIANCGARPHARGAWRSAQRATAAHSALVLGNANSSDVLSSGHLGRRPRHVLCRREDAEGAALIDAGHDGYMPSFGTLHRRRIYLAPEGEDLRGEDRLTRMRPGSAVPFALRFHLHPDVQASLMHDGKAVLLRLASGTGLRFDAAGGRIAIEESIYLGGEGGPRRTEQIVIESTLAGEEAVVKWSLKRMAG